MQRVVPPKTGTMINMLHSPAELILTQIYRYPVKSCRGHRLSQAQVEPWGLLGDRRWMLVNEAGRVVSARQIPRLLVAVPRPCSGGIVVTAPGMPELRIPAPDGATVSVDVWGNEVKAAEAAQWAAGWFSELAGTPLRLVYLDDPTRRPVNPKYAKPDDRVSFADGYPLLLTSEASLARLNVWIAAGSHAAEGPLPMTRFRPSVVVSGAPAWDEDNWRAVRIGDVNFRVGKGCDRCVLTTLDPDTTRRGREPLATLAQYRRWGGKVWFGINLIPDTQDRSISVGDPVEVLRRR